MTNDTAPSTLSTSITSFPANNDYTYIFPSIATWTSPPPIDKTAVALEIIQLLSDKKLLKKITSVDQFRATVKAIVEVL